MPFYDAAAALVIVAHALKKNGTRALRTLRTGFTLNGAKNAQDAAAYGGGVYVDALEQNGAAYMGGVKRSMEVTAVNGTSTTGMTVPDVLALLAKGGTTAEVDVRTNEKLVYSYSTRAKQQDEKHSVTGEMHGKGMHASGAKFVSFFMQNNPTVAICGVVDGEELLMATVDMGDAKDSSTPRILEERVAEVGAKYATHTLSADVLNDYWYQSKDIADIKLKFKDNFMNDMATRLPGLHDLIARDEDGQYSMEQLFLKADYAGAAGRIRTFPRLVEDIVNLVRALGAEPEDLQEGDGPPALVSAQGLKRSVTDSLPFDGGPILSRTDPNASRASTSSQLPDSLDFTVEGQAEKSMLAASYIQEVNEAKAEDAAAYQPEPASVNTSFDDLGLKLGPRLSQATLERPKSPGKRPPTRGRASRGSSSLATEDLILATAAAEESVAVEVPPASSVPAPAADSVVLGEDALELFDILEITPDPDAVLTPQQLDGALGNSEFIGIMERRNLKVTLTADPKADAARIMGILDVNSTGTISVVALMNAMKDDKAPLEVAMAVGSSGTSVDVNASTARTEAMSFNFAFG